MFLVNDPDFASIRRAVPRYTNIPPDFPLLGSGPIFSFVKVNPAYFGPCCVIRRASDSTTKTIYFNDAGIADFDTLATFISGTNGYLTTWYDQSGLGLNGVQATAANQPKIVPEYFKGLPGLLFSGSQSLSISNMPLKAAGALTAIMQPTSLQNVWTIGTANGAATGVGIGFNANSTMLMHTTTGTSTNSLASPSATYAANKTLAFTGQWDQRVLSFNKDGVVTGLGSNAYDPTATITTFPLVANGYSGYVGAIMFWQRRLLRWDNIQIANHHRMFGITPPSATIVFSGDSVTAGYPLTAADTYPTQCMATLNTWDPTILGKNVAVAGATLAYSANSISSRAISIGSDPYLCGGGNAIDVVWGGSNDMALNGDTGAQAAARYAQYVGLRKMQGISVVGITCMVRNGINNADRLDFNSALRSLTTLDAVIDLDTNPSLMDYTNLTYFQADGIHLTRLGYGQVAAMVDPAIRSVMATL